MEVNCSHYTEMKAAVWTCTSWESSEVLRNGFCNLNSIWDRKKNNNNKKQCSLFPGDSLETHTRIISCCKCRELFYTASQLQSLKHREIFRQGLWCVESTHWNSWACSGKCNLMMQNCQVLHLWKKGMLI